VIATFSDPFRITADDVLAVAALGVVIPANEAAELVYGNTAAVSEALKRIPLSVTLWNASDDVIGAGSAAWDAWELLERPYVGRTSKSKLLAVKRPALLPVWDTKIDAYLGGYAEWWLPLRDALRDDALRAAAAAATSTAPRHVTLLRRMDVALWMAAKRFEAR
jgi:hypothetical protein